MLLREYQHGDEEALARIYRDAVRNTGRLAYDPPQIEAWAAFADGQPFGEQLRQGLTLVALDGDRAAAFGQLHPQDHVALLYTASDHARQGFATRVYAALEAHAAAGGATSLHVDASRIARHFFLKMGFHVLEAQRITRQGTVFERFSMEKRLA